MHNIAIVDDHVLVANGIAKLIETHSNNFKVVHLAQSAHDFIFYLKQKSNEKIDVAIIDYDMSGLNGVDLSYLLSRDFPTIKKIGISSCIHFEKKAAFLYNGCKGFISKCCSTYDLIQAINCCMVDKYFMNQYVNDKLIKQIESKQINFEFPLDLKDNYYLFLKLCNTNLTYKSIAIILNIPENTLHKIQQRLFKKFDVENRVDLIKIVSDNNLFSNHLSF